MMVGKLINFIFFYILLQSSKSPFVIEPWIGHPKITLISQRAPLFQITKAVYCN